MEELKKYISLVDFLGKALGKRYEVVLHDLSIPEKSIIAIANGEISGRKLGGPVTDLLLKLLKKGRQEHVSYIVNYRGKSNNKLCRSSSYFIRNRKKAIIGVLCINVDITPFMKLKVLLDNELSFMNIETERTVKNDITENLEGNIDELIDNMIAFRLNQYTSIRNKVSLDDRMSLVRNLYNDGFFLLRGSVNALAERIGVSEPTIYRYLNRIRRQIENESK